MLLYYYGPKEKKSKKKLDFRNIVWYNIVTYGDTDFNNGREPKTKGKQT